MSAVIAVEGAAGAEGDGEGVTDAEGEGDALGEGEALAEVDVGDEDVVAVGSDAAPALAARPTTTAAAKACGRQGNGAELSHGDPL